MRLLKEVVIPEHGYTPESLPYIALLEVLCEMSPGEQREFVKFVTGTPRLPRGGIGALQPHLKVVRREEPNVPGGAPQINKAIALPSVMTYEHYYGEKIVIFWGCRCQNYMKLPNYKSKEELKEKLFQAMREGSEKFLLT